MTRRTKLLLLILGIAVVLIIGILLLWRARTTFTGTQTQVRPDEIPSGQVIEVPVLDTNELESALSPDISALQVLVRVFVERYASFSTESDFANLRDALPFMTEAFAGRTQAEMEKGNTGTAFYAVTTRLVSTQVLDLDEAAGTARVSVSTQRNESIGSPQNSTLGYRDMLLELRKLQGVWKVDSAVWQDPS